MSLRPPVSNAGFALSSDTSSHWATTSSASLPSHWSSPSFHVFAPSGSSFSPMVSSLSESLTSVSSRKVPRVAFSPAPLCENGWMWMTPSPWVWMPVVASNSGMSGCHSPQT